MPLRAFIDSEGTPLQVGLVSAKYVLMPLRAFIDSENKFLHFSSSPNNSVLMPLRAFIDSETFQSNFGGTFVRKCLNALTGIY